jgi:hypothetical protein
VLYNVTTDLMHLKVEGVSCFRQLPSTHQTDYLFFPLLFSRTPGPSPSSSTKITPACPRAERTFATVLSLRSAPASMRVIVSCETSANSAACRTVGGNATGSAGRQRDIASDCRLRGDENRKAALRRCGHGIQRPTRWCGQEIAGR